MRSWQNGCNGCDSQGQVIQRTLAETEDCIYAGCLLELFMQSARAQLQHFHVGKFPFLSRIVTNPLDVAVIATGDLLDKDGIPRIGEIRRFVQCDGDECQNSVGKMRERWDRYVAVRLRLTIGDLRGEDDPWTKKIRGAVEQAVWKSKDLRRVPCLEQALYFRPADGYPMLEGERVTAERIVTGLLERKVQREPIATILASVFDFLRCLPYSCRALSIAEMTRIVYIFHGAYYLGELEGHEEDTRTMLDDEEQRIVDSTVNFLIHGRLKYYLHRKIYTKGECEIIVSLVRKYLEDLMQWKILPLREYLDSVPSMYETSSQDPRKLKRIANLFMHARIRVEAIWRQK